MGTRIVDWRGPQVLERVLQATAEGIDETTEEAARVARASHWWVSRTPQLQDEIIAEPAERSARLRVTGRFGTTQRRGFYGLFLERRTPFLRPAADLMFPQLAGSIKRRLK